MYNVRNILLRIVFFFFPLLAGTSSQVSSLRRPEEDDMAFFERRYQERVSLWRALLTLSITCNKHTVGRLYIGCELSLKIIYEVFTYSWC